MVKQEKLTNQKLRPDLACEVRPGDIRRLIKVKSKYAGNLATATHARLHNTLSSNWLGLKTVELYPKVKGLK